MYAPHNRHVAPSVPQVHHPAFQRDQGRGTGRIDNVIRATEIQTVGNPTRHKVRHQRGRDFRVERRQRRLEGLFHLGQLFWRGVGVQLFQDLQKPVDHDPMLHHAGKATVDIGPAPKDHRHTVAGHGALIEPCVLNRVGRHFQRQKLIRFTAVDRGRHHPMAQRIEGRQIAQKPALGRVNAVVFGTIRVQKQVAMPIGGRLVHRIHPI